MDLRKVFDCMISVSELGRGQASKVIQAVEDEGSPYIVIKNNKPQAVIISIDEYTELMRARDYLNSLQTMNTPLYNHEPRNNAVAYPFAGQASSQASSSEYSQAKAGTLTEDEINIFLENEEND